MDQEYRRATAAGCDQPSLPPRCSQRGGVGSGRHRVPLPTALRARTPLQALGPDATYRGGSEKSTKHEQGSPEQLAGAGNQATGTDDRGPKASLSSLDAVAGSPIESSARLTIPSIRRWCYVCRTKGWLRHVVGIETAQTPLGPRQHDSARPWVGVESALYAIYIVAWDLFMGLSPVRRTAPTAHQRSSECRAGGPATGGGQTTSSRTGQDRPHCPFSRA